MKNKFEINEEVKISKVALIFRKYTSMSEYLKSINWKYRFNTFTNITKNIGIIRNFAAHFDNFEKYGIIYLVYIPNMK